MLRPARLAPVSRALGLALTLLAGAGCAASRPGPIAELRLGVAAARLGLWQEALARFETAAEQAPGKAAAWNNLAVAYEKLGRLSESRAAYRKALALSPGSRHVRRNLDAFRERHGADPPAEPSSPGAP